MQRRQPLGAKGRLCSHCGKVFKPMTDKMWENVWLVHFKSSVRHGFGTVLAPFAKESGLGSQINGSSNRG